jgi:3-dehydroquinate dehydratase-1
MTLICLTVAVEGIDEAVETANSVECDVVEVRLDHLADTSNLKKLSSIKKPLMATCMPKWEGGKYGGEEPERIRVLESALDYCDYVSIELKTESKLRDGLIEKARELGVSVILAYHDFDKTPPLEEILETLKEEVEAGADIAKVAYMPEDKLDVLTVMNVLAEYKLDTPIIALSMGELGRISRVMAIALGAYLTFGCAEHGREAAPGQLTVGELNTFRELLS